MISTELKSHFAKTRFLGQGAGRVCLSESEIAWILMLTAGDLGLPLHNASLKEGKDFPLFYDASIPSELPKEWNELSTNDLLEELSHLCVLQADVRLYFTNLCAILKRRIKYQTILSTQPKPTMDQIGPRSLLEYGVMQTSLLGSWMMWRKWIFDIDNRSGQETGYLFEPILASCMGGTTVAASKSPVKRVNERGEQTAAGRQIDCLDVDAKVAYEFKLRVSIAASGQGRFAEELSFPVECKVAGLKPVLIVLDPTPSTRLTELTAAFEANGGVAHIIDAWEFIEEKAGDCMSRFIELYLRPVLLDMTAYDDALPKPIDLAWSDGEIRISSGDEVFRINRTRK